jgi:hypothetical protein
MMSMKKRRPLTAVFLLLLLTPWLAGTRISGPLPAGGRTPGVISADELTPLMPGPLVSGPLVQGTLFQGTMFPGTMFPETGRMIRKLDLSALDEDSTGEYRETQLRRFETIFFISLPATFLLSFFGAFLFRGATDSTRPFSSQEYTYIALSTVGISLIVALNDNRAVYHGENRMLRGRM